MSLKNGIDHIVETYREEARRTQLLVKFLSAFAVNESDRLFSTSGEVRKYQSGAAVCSKNSTDVIQVPRDLLESFEELLSQRGKEIQSLPHLMLKISFVHLVTLFESALSDLIREVLTYRPEILKSKKQITYEDVLSHDSMEGLVSKMIDREIGGIAYDSVADIFDYLRIKLALPVELTQEEMGELISIKAKRNVIVHNQGRVDSKYLRAVGGGDDLIGAMVFLDSEDWNMAFNLFDKMVVLLKDAVERKFRLI